MQALRLRSEAALAPEGVFRSGFNLGWVLGGILGPDLEACLDGRCQPRGGRQGEERRPALGSWTRLKPVLGQPDSGAHAQVNICCLWSFRLRLGTLRTLRMGLPKCPGQGPSH